jgi:hypothetical protein
VALLTARSSGPGLSRAELLSGCAPGEVVAALVVVAGALLDALPGDNGGSLLERLGLLAATWSLPEGGPA